MPKLHCQCDYKFHIIYSPLFIYKINNSTSNNYAIYHTVAQNLITISGQDTTQSFNMRPTSEVTNREEIVNLMSNYLNEKINEFISTNIATIKNVSDNKIVFLIDENSIGRLKPRMIFEIQRIYWWKSNDHELINRMINLRMNDLISYEKQVDRNKNSKYYNEYYNGAYTNQTLGIDYTKEELEAFYDSTHFMYTLKDLAGSQGGAGYSTDIKVQIDAIYDSTVSATIYSTANPNIILRKGDIFKY